MFYNNQDINLISGNRGKDCPGNGKKKNETGDIIECCCDECDYFLECFPEYMPKSFQKKQLDAKIRST